MNKTVKGILGGSICLVVLIVGFVALQLTDKTSETDDEELVAEESHTFYEHDANEVNKVVVTNSEGGYTLYRTEPAIGDSDATYSIEGIEQYALNTSVVSTIANNCSSISALAEVDESPTDLSQYGFDSPQAEVTLYLDDGTTESFILGDDSPVEGVYFKMSDSDTVFTVDSTPMYVFSKNQNYFISRQCLEIPDEYPIVESLTIKRSDLDYDIVLEYDSTESNATSASHVMTSPVFSYLDSESSEDITTSMFGLTADSIVKLSPTEEDLTVAGIDYPTCEVSMVCNDGNVYNLKVGTSFEGSSYGDDYTAYFGYFEGIDILYAFTDSSIPWLTLNPMDITSQIVIGNYIYDVANMTIQTSDTTLNFEGSGNSDDFSVKLNGTDFDLNRYKSFYQALIKTPAEELYLDEVTGTPEVTIVQTLQSGSTDTFELYRISDRKVAIVHNGVSSFACRSSFLDNCLLPNLENVNGNDDFVTSW